MVIQYKNLSEDEKQRLVECRKNYSKTWKYKTTSQMRIYQFLVGTLISLLSFASIDGSRAVSRTHQT